MCPSQLKRHTSIPKLIYRVIEQHSGDKSSARKFENCIRQAYNSQSYLEPSNAQERAGKRTKNRFHTHPSVLELQNTELRCISLVMQLLRQSLLENLLFRRTRSVRYFMCLTSRSVRSAILFVRSESFSQSISNGTCPLQI